MQRLTILIAAFCCATVFAQTDANCVICWTVTDNTCSEQSNCDNWGGAEFYTFTAPCNYDYIFICKTECSSEDQTCHVCATCSRLVRTSGNAVIGRCRTTMDGNGTCEWPCDNTAYVDPPALTQGTEYRLEVSLQRCGDVDNCSACTSCTAKARVYHPSATCSAW